MIYERKIIRDEIRETARWIVRESANPRIRGRYEGRLFTFAESCTGGLVAHSVSEVAGASEVFPGSVVTYSNRAKIEMLDVTPETIDRHGAVSGECAAEMACGALRLFDSMFAVSVTGIAGPSGGSASKPVGLVWLALARADGIIRLRRGLYGGQGRRAVQLRAARSALKMLLCELLGEV
ncbi:MAG: CinA family protein [Synergistaceae bacterium]|jgi:nicotinamide-nucleotide amidase|nr:CinA family protein [Synergistaceae bacterium]